MKAKTKKAKKTVAKKREYYFSFDFYVSGREMASLDIDGKKREPKKNKKTGKVRRQRGYFITLEVKSTSKQGAAQKIRNRIAKMADVQNVPDFHYSEVKRGLAVLVSDGHTTVRMCKFKRPGVEAKVEAPAANEADHQNVIDLHAAAMRRRSGGCMSY